MNEDYLWNKDGEDPEVAKLENQLKSFRSDNTTLPKIPANQFVVAKDFTQKKNSFSFFRLAFASSAVLGMLLLAIGVFQVVQSETSPTIAKDAEIKPLKGKPIAAEKVLVNDEAPSEKAPTEELQKEKKVTKTVFISQSNPKKRVYSASRRAQKKVRTRKAKSRKTFRGKANVKPNGDTVLLTKEEKYAYEQLMKALTITTNKLKIVRDKVNGAE